MTDRRERQVTSGFASRLRQVIDAHGSTNSIAKGIERSEGAVRKWLRGESEPNVTDLRALCEQTHTNVEWLVTGHGRRENPAEPSSPLQDSTPLSLSLLEAIMQAVESEVCKDGVDLPAPKRAMLITTLYNLSQESRQVDSEAVARLVKLAR